MNWHDESLQGQQLPGCRNGTGPNAANVSGACPCIADKSQLVAGRAHQGVDLRLTTRSPLPYNLPVENCGIAHLGGPGWWWGPNCRARSVAELLGIRLLCHVRNANCVFNVTPDIRGKIPDDQAKALFDLRKTYESLGV